jgi:hypothetical protein
MKSSSGSLQRGSSGVREADADETITANRRATVDGAFMILELANENLRLARTKGRLHLEMVVV